VENRRPIIILSIVGGAVGLLFCAAIAVAVALSVSGSRLQESIIGPWRSETGSDVVEFYRDGTVEARPDGGETTRSTYEFVDGNTLRIESGGVGFIYDVQISGDTLTMTGDDGETLTLTRLK
jgi:hypothetical protein